MPTVTIEQDSLKFAFPELHERAELSVEFVRTLRLPDDGKSYPLPPGLGAFPLRDVDDFAARVPTRWVEDGGVMLPMYQAEALWLSFASDGWPRYPFAVKVSTGGICALTGERSSPGLSRSPQNYLVVPEQPWLDGFNVGEGKVRQFVAVPLASEVSVEHQLKGEASEGGMELEVIPMTAAAFKKLERTHGYGMAGRVCCSAPEASGPDMGFAAGGLLRQEVYEDTHAAKDWSKLSARCRVNVCNSLAWRAITGDAPPTEPPGPKHYRKARIPFFDYYDDKKALPGSAALASLESFKHGREAVDFTAERVIELRRIQGLGPSAVRMRDSGARS
jgi:hypothetical protein